MTYTSEYQYVAQFLGLTEHEFRHLTPEEIHRLIEKKKKVKLTFKSLLAKILPRGNPLIASEKFIDHDKIIKDFEKSFQK